MKLATAGFGFVIGYNLVVGGKAIKDTITGDMPRPKYQGFFIGGMALLTAGLLYFNIFNPQEQSGNALLETEEDETKPIGTPMELGQGLDWTPYDESVSVLGFRKRDAEGDEELYCCICGVNLLDTGEKYGHNPDPIARLPNVCCGDCNAIHVIPARIKQMGLGAEEADQFASEKDAYNLAYNQGFDDGRSQKRISRTVFAPDQSYTEDQKLFEHTYRRREG